MFVVNYLFSSESPYMWIPTLITICSAASLAFRTCGDKVREEDYINSDEAKEKSKIVEELRARLRK